MSWLSATSIRIALAAALAVSVVFGHPFVALCVALALAIRFRAYEVLIMAVVMDLMFAPRVWPLIPVATICALLIVFGLEPLRRNLMQ